MPQKIAALKINYKLFHCKISSRSVVMEANKCIHLLLQFESKICSRVWL